MTAPSRRPGRLVVVISAALCIALAGGIGGWLYLRSSNGTDVCKELSKDKRVRSALGAGSPDAESCSRLGSAIQRATTGEKAGVHSVAQAQAMKNVLLALGDITDKTEEELDSALAVPVSKALADYMPDVSQILSPGNIDYVRAGVASAPPWKDDDGIHMSLSRVTLLHVMRHLANHPASYAQLRDAASQRAAGSFTAVPRDAEEWRFESPTRETAYVLGAMDAVAEDVQKDLGEDGWKDWNTDVFSQLTKTSSTLPSYQDDPAGHVEISWQHTLRAAGRKNMLARFGTQTADMVQVWGKGAALDGELQKSLLKNARDISMLGLHQTARDLS
ncbi:hypothetical protein ACFY93_14110 [Streptomyces sp. NPDC008313]|uniref:hypothetical protein n=1 Tax=Streptomyces sp. NPDC008313 TaxID=3364826 RepID=UPI0036EC29A7